MSPTVPPLRVSESELHGLGVFAMAGFAAGEVIERCPVLGLEREDAWVVSATALGDYVYEWGDGAAVALGFGSLYNHSSAPNAFYEMHYDEDEIWIVAYRDIAPGEEVLVNYNGEPDVDRPVWFEDGYDPDDRLRHEPMGDADEEVEVHAVEVHAVEVDVEVDVADRSPDGDGQLSTIS